MKFTTSLFVAISIIVSTSSDSQSSISTVGFNLLNAKVTGNQVGLAGTNGTVYLLSNPVKDNGILFAFAAMFYSDYPVKFQIYRPQNATDSFRLLAELFFTPSIKRGQENIYIESLFGRSCVRVEKGDRLGLCILSDPPSVIYGFDPFNPILKYSATLPSIGDFVKFDQVSLPQSFYAEGFLYADNDTNSNSSADVDCIPGITIPQNQINQIYTTTTMKMVGAIGDTGVQGMLGSFGATGATGRTGITGATGAIGAMGLAGWTGPMGFTGQQGFSGNTGLTGIEGINGSMGSIGELGDTGNIGPVGSVGQPGLDIVVIKSDAGPTEYANSEIDQSYFMSTNSIWPIYIWLAIVTIVLIIVLIFLIVICNFLFRFSQSSLERSTMHGSSDKIIDS